MSGAEDASVAGIVDLLGIGILGVSRSGRVCYANRFARELIGIGAEELVGSVLPPQLRELAELLEDSFANGGKSSRIISIGTARLAAHANVAGEGVAVMLQPLSDLDPISEELRAVRELNRELQEIFDSSYDEIFVTDADGTALRVSRAACKRLYGVEPEEIVGKNVEELVSPNVEYSIFRTYPLLLRAYHQRAKTLWIDCFLQYCPLS